jgi:cysteine desulfurase
LKVYFDNAASTIVREEAIKAMTDFMRADFGNPSSMHKAGRLALAELNSAREGIAKTLDTKAETIYFTSGGTEANNWAVLGVVKGLARFGKHIITSKTEHSAVLAPIEKLISDGWDVTYLEPDINGQISVDVFTKALRNDTVFASIMLVNNEMGVINPIGEYAQEIKRQGLKTILHTDAVAAFCKIPFTTRLLGADLISISSHKIHGPKGVGAIYVSDKVKLSPLFLGGKHEKGKRGGTEALPAIIGFSTAARLGNTELSETSNYIRNLRDITIIKLKEALSEIIIIGEDSFTSPHILCISLPGYKSEVLMNYLDGKDIYVSKGAACKKGARSKTLEAMKLPNDVIDGALRISFSRYSTIEEIEYFVNALKEASQNIQK